MLDQLREERKDQQLWFWIQLEKAKVKLRPTDESIPKCHRDSPEDHLKWCDAKGPGGFMGHTCKPFDGGKWPINVPFNFEAKFAPTLVPTFTPTEAVNHPAHYGGDTVYEAIKVIEAWELGFELGNVLKYIKRSGRDGLPIFSKRQRYPERIEDLKKAKRYLEFKIEQLEKQANLRPISDVRVSSANDICAKCGDIFASHSHTAISGGHTFVAKNGQS